MGKQTYKRTDIIQTEGKLQSVLVQATSRKNNSCKSALVEPISRQKDSCKSAHVQPISRKRIVANLLMFNRSAGKTIVALFYTKTRSRGRGWGWGWGWGGGGGGGGGGGELKKLEDARSLYCIYCRYFYNGSYGSICLPLFPLSFDSIASPGHLICDRLREVY